MRTRAVETGRVEGNEGEWVLVVDGTVVVSSPNPEKVLMEAENYPGRDTLVTKILSAGASFY